MNFPKIISSSSKDPMTVTFVFLIAKWTPNSVACKKYYPQDSFKSFYLEAITTVFQCAVTAARNRNSLAVCTLRMVRWSAVCILSSAARFLVLMWLV